MRPLVLVLGLLVVGVGAAAVVSNNTPKTPDKEPDKVLDPEPLPPPEKKGYSLGEACGQLTVTDGATGLSWAYDQGRAAKTQAEAFARVFEGCGEASVAELGKLPASAGFMYLLARATWKGLVAGGGLDQATAQQRLTNWRALALAAGVAPELLPEDV